jgi:hypothetical protein
MAARACARDQTLKSHAAATNLIACLIGENARAHIPVARAELIKVTLDSCFALPGYEAAAASGRTQSGLETWLSDVSPGAGILHQQLQSKEITLGQSPWCCEATPQLSEQL